MSKFSSNFEKELNMKNAQNIETALEKNNLFCSESKIVPDSICSSNEENISENLVNYASNSYSINEKNELFNSLMNSKNQKDKEFSLLYLINTFGKSYSSESDEKKKMIIDLPKISKNLFSKPQAKYSSSKNLDNISFQKNLPIKKSCSKGGIMNNFFSSIYEKQMSSGKLMEECTVGQKSCKAKALYFNSGNKSSKLDVAPFVHDNYKFSNLFNDNKEGINIDMEKMKQINDKGKSSNKRFNTSLLQTSLEEEKNNNNI